MGDDIEPFEAGSQQGPRAGRAGPERAPFREAPLATLAAWARFWAAMLVTIVTMVFCFFWALPGLAMPEVTGRRWMLGAARMWSHCILWAARCKVEVSFDGPRPEGGFLFFANHQSSLDIPALFVALRDTPFAYAAKRELFSVPFIGWYLRLAGFIEVDRANRKRSMASFDKAAKQLQRGLVVCVYPEGTRSEDGALLPFKKGPFVLAISSQRPIVPVAIEGAQHAVRKHTQRLYGNTIRVRVGRPIETAGLTLDDRGRLADRVRAEILALHEAAAGATAKGQP
jgi:1-acyl-sn-glycerol-3-phosphate acyltransferase